MIMEGVALGAITLGAFGITYSRLPKKCKVFMCKHPLLTDVVCAVFFYEVMGMTLVAHVACATMCLGVQGFLHVQSNPDDYQFLFDLVNTAKIQMNSSLEKLKSLCKQLNESAKAKQEVIA